MATRAAGHRYVREKYIHLYIMIIAQKTLPYQLNNTPKKRPEKRHIAQSETVPPSSLRLHAPSSLTYISDSFHMPVYNSSQLNYTIVADTTEERSETGRSMKYRHEWKHEINYADRLILLPRLDAVMKRDSHAINGIYRIRSLYFDTPSDTALRDKIDGVNIRDKYRIRYYNGDTSFIVLEKKSKRNGLCLKESARLSEDEAGRIVRGEISWMADCGRQLCTELYSRMRTENLAPKTIVDYTRDPFVFEPGNVRVTIDYDIRTGLSGTDFLDPSTVTVPAGTSPIVLEVKWDDFLPDIIKDAVTLPGRRVCAFSKYEQCRIYG